VEFLSVHFVQTYCMWMGVVDGCCDHLTFAEQDNERV
jgi:hypothetical protein